MTGSFVFNKKSQAGRNILAAVIFLLVFGMLTLIGTLVSFEIIDTIDNSSIANPTIHAAAANFKNVYYLFDKIIFLVAIVFIIGIAVTSYKLAARPVFFVVTFISAAFYGFLSYIFSYIFSQFATQSAFDSIRSMFPVTIILLTNLHWIALTLIIVGAIALFAKRPTSGGEGDYLR